MENLWEYWYMLPISIVIATIAMSSGVGGAVFFSPIFMILLKLDPTTAVGTALMTEFFGFTSGVIAYGRAKLIDYKLAVQLLIFAIPAAVVGSLVAPYFPAVVLKTVFAVGIIFIGWQLYSSYRKEEKEKADKGQEEEFEQEYESTLTDRNGKVFKYTVCNKPMGRVFATMGGFFLGMISVGLAEIQEYQLIARCRIPSPVAVGTSVFVVVIAVLAASAGHIMGFAAEADAEKLAQVGKLVMFTAPGVIIGGQIGPMLQSKINPDIMKVSVAILFVAIGLFMLSTLAFA